MWWIFESLYSFAYNSVLEFVFFVLVDVVAKTPLKDARNQEEKRLIWLYESVFLALITVLIYLVDHTPYLLIVLTLLTFVYTQLCGRVDFRYWWGVLRTRWEEHQQHQESLQMIRQQQAQRQKMQADKQTVTWDGGRNKKVPSQIQQRLYQFSPLVQQQPKMYPPGPTTTSAVAQTEENNSSTFWSRASSKLQLRNPWSTANSSYTRLPPDDPPLASEPSNPQALSPPSRNSWFSKNDLRRRPLRQDYLTDKSYPTVPSGTGVTLRSKFLSAFGLTGSNKPAGLRNEGQNLCFMNCVVQCLARSPCLVDQLVQEVKCSLDCSLAESTLLSSLVDLLKSCSAKPGTLNTSMLDSLELRQAVSVLNERLCAPLTERQTQQDAAEFFMWLMETLHTVLNKKTSNSASRQTGSKDMSNLAMLKFIYGDLTPSRIQGLKDACKQEISQANGLDNNSYAEAIQRLSDLEWLTYKQTNNSTIDNLFTGQLVEAYHCLTDNHLSVNMQTFNILPVPLVDAQGDSGLIFLGDCFTKFCNVEHLVGTEGLECSFCAERQTNTRSSTSRHNHRTPVSNPKQKFSSVDSAVHSPLSSTAFMSPIPGTRETINDSGFQDNVFKTSTPISDTGVPMNSFPTQRLRDAQRRCLLRQLPDCLVIQLLRFTYNAFSQQTRKISKPVSIPLKGLDMSSIVYDSVTNREDLTAVHSDFKYDLYGVCLHLGSESTSCGHYVCYCRSDDGTWYKFDDELVIDVNMDYELTTREVRENAYLLFYRKAVSTPVPAES